MVKKLLAFTIFTVAATMLFFGFMGHQQQVKVAVGPDQAEYNATLNEPELITAVHTNSLIGKEQTSLVRQSYDLLIDRSGACAT